MGVGEGGRRGHLAVSVPGSVYKKYPQGRGRRRPESSIELPRKDTVCSSREVGSGVRQCAPPSSNSSPTVNSGGGGQTWKGGDTCWE